MAELLLGLPNVHLRLPKAVTNALVKKRLSL